MWHFRALRRLEKQSIILVGKEGLEGMVQPFLSSEVLCIERLGFLEARQCQKRGYRQCPFDMMVSAEFMSVWLA